MKLTSFEDWNCSLAQALHVVGERWTLLILRDAFLGLSGFDEFQRHLGIARNILSARLKQLTEDGILEKEPGGRGRYRLTDKGYDLVPVLLALAHWGDRHKPHPSGARLTFVERDSGQPIQRMAPHAADGRPLDPRDLDAQRGPALTD